MPEGIAAEGGRAAALHRTLADSALARRVRTDIAHEIAGRGGAPNVIVFDYTDTTLYEKSLADIASRWKLDPVEATIRVQLEGLPNRAGGARMRGFSMSEIDMGIPKASTTSS